MAILLSPGAWHRLSKKQAKNKSFKDFFLAGIRNILDMWMGVAPIVMALGTLALIIAEYTPVFQWLGMPFIPLLELMQVPEAKAASETLIVGFADMFLPSVIGADIASPMTRFIVASVSVTQLIYMSEVGGLFARIQDSCQLRGIIHHFPSAYASYIANHRIGCTYSFLR